MQLENKVAIVTGGGSGIGRAIAQRLGQEGAEVAICGRNKAALEDTASEFRSSGLRLFHMECDVRKANQVERFVTEVVDRYGQINVLVNNAGVSGHTPIRNPRDRDWHQIIDANLTGPYLFLTRVEPQMPDSSRVINVSSILGRFGVPGYAAYCASKHGLIGLTRAAALELAPRRITVNAVCPGWVETDMARTGMERGAKGRGITYEQFRKEALEAVPLGQMIEPAEVAALVAFLASDVAANVTGQTYNICGGQTMD